MRTYIHTDIHTCMHTYIINVFIHSFIQKYTHTYIHTHRCRKMQRLAPPNVRIKCVPIEKEYAVSFGSPGTMLQHVAVCCSMLQHVAVCCSMSQCFAVPPTYVWSMCPMKRGIRCQLAHPVLCSSMLQHVAVCCSMLQYVAVCKGLLCASICVREICAQLIDHGKFTYTYVHVPFVSRGGGLGSRPKKM